MKPQRKFIGREGDYSVDNKGPEAIKTDIDSLMRIWKARHCIQPVQVASSSSGSFGAGLSRKAKIVLTSAQPLRT